MPASTMPSPSSDKQGDEPWPAKDAIPHSDAAVEGFVHHPPGYSLQAGPGLDGSCDSQGRSTLVRLYTSSWCQLMLLSSIFFLCPGMLNALNGMGGGGQVDATVAAQANIALYACFSVLSFFSGSIVARIGVRASLVVGALGYTLYCGSFWSYNLNSNGAFVTASGALLGLCAALVWTVQGALVLALPTERQRGRFIATFWILLNLGACIGAAIQLGLSYYSQTSTVSDGTYIAFTVLTLFGALLGLAVLPPARIIRSDGTRVSSSLSTPSSTPSLVGGRPRADWKRQVAGSALLLIRDPWVLVLLPCFLASNWFYTWQFNCFNGALFTLRTRALNSTVYWMSQMASSLLLGRILDERRFGLRTRAWIGLAITAVLTAAVFGGSYAKQRDYTRSSVADGTTRRIDFTDAASIYTPLLILFLLMGALDAIWQCYTLYLIGTISNDFDKLAHLAGLYKCFQSAGAAVAFALDRNHQPFMTQLAVCWALALVGCVCFAFVVHYRVAEEMIGAQEEEVEAGSVDVAVAPPVKNDKEAQV